MNPTQHDYLLKIEEASVSLLGIINDILDSSKIEAGKLQLERIDFSLDDVLHKLRSLMSVDAEDKGLSFEVEIDSQVSRNLLGDPTRLRQILINLVGNAIKFTEKGQVLVKVSERKTTERIEGTEQIQLYFEVIDSGIGISSDIKRSYFKPLTKLIVLQPENTVAQALG